MNISESGRFSSQGKLWLEAEIVANKQLRWIQCPHTPSTNIATLEQVLITSHLDYCYSSQLTPWLQPLLTGLHPAYKNRINALNILLSSCNSGSYHLQVKSELCNMPPWTIHSPAFICWPNWPLDASQFEASSFTHCLLIYCPIYFACSSYLTLYIFIFSLNICKIICFISWKSFP